jgi:hypothetical protein
MSRGDRGRVGDLAPGPGADERDRAGCRVVRGVPGQGVGSPTFRVDIECGVCLERCPFEVDILAKMRADARHRTAAAVSEGQAA